MGSGGKRYVDEAANIELNEQISRLLEFGVSQNEMSRKLGVSSSQLSRMKNGERQATQNHLRLLRKIRTDRARTVLRKERTNLPTKLKRASSRQLPFFSISTSLLGQLSPESAIQAFRDLLWAEAARRSIPAERVVISGNIYAADGGIDASLHGDCIEGAASQLLCNGARFQVKAGKAEPWKLSWTKRELFGCKQPKAEHLGAGVQRCMIEGGVYTLVCFGVDFVDEQLRMSEENVRTLLRECGYSKPKVRVLGQTQLVGLFQLFPSLCIRLRGHDQAGFRTHATWSRAEDMRPRLELGPEQQQLIEEIRQHLRAGDIRHIRLIGEPGVGKTRLALEATRTSDLAPVVVYVPDSASFQRSSFINELIQDDESRFVVLVIDECVPKDSASIWNVLKGRENHTRLMTIDHGPDVSNNDGIKVVPVPGTRKEEIVAIIVAHGVPKHDAERWAGFCEGSPRVAHVIGENLMANREDLLQTPGTTQVWERFIAGHDDPQSEGVELRKIVLRHLSLFERFGFEPPVEKEAEFIAGLAEQCDPRLTWGRFQSIVHDLKQRRIVQGNTTLYVTPRLLRVYLYTEFWDHHGRAIDLAEQLRAMPPQLWQWFVEMLCFAHRSTVAERAVERLIGPNGFFPSTIPDLPANGRLITALAEAIPEQTLRCLERTIGRADLSDLKSFREARQWIVWALERIAVSSKFFSRAAELLLLLAEAENATCSNNATGTFKGLFSLIPGFGATEAAPEIRLGVLRDALDSDSEQRRSIALGACEVALSTFGGSRIIGAEHQGLRRTVEFWRPSTYGELWDAYRNVWRLLVSKLASWRGDERHKLIGTLVKAASSVLRIQVLTSEVLETLESIEPDECINIKAMVDFIDRQLRHEEGKLDQETTKRLQSMRKRLDGHDFGSKLRRFVKHVTFEDSYGGTGRRGVLDQRLNELAKEALSSRHVLSSELPWLVCETSSPAFSFGYRLGHGDAERVLLTEILTVQAAQHGKSAPAFLGGYFAAIFEQAPGEWETQILAISDSPTLRMQCADLVISSGMTDAAAKKVIELCRIGALDRQCLERWWFSRRICQLEPGTFEEVIEVQLCGDDVMWSNAVHMCHTYYLHDGHSRDFSNEFMFGLLTHAALADERQSQDAGHYWSMLSQAFLTRYPEQKWTFFKQVLFHGTKHWSVLQDLDMNEGKVLSAIVQGDPMRAWQCIAEVYRRDDGAEMFGLGHWLSDGGRGFDEVPGPIRFIPSDELFRWIDEDIDDRAHWVARLLPKTIESAGPGKLTRDFIAKYGKNKSVANTVWAHFHSRGWWGSESDHYRAMRDEARTWLKGEGHSVVKGWINDYIDGLSHYIERAEIEEERRL